MDDTDLLGAGAFTHSLMSCNGDRRVLKRWACQSRILGGKECVKEFVDREPPEVAQALEY